MYSPIGFFDSGCGGLSVLNAVQQLLPKYDYVYLGDNAYAPYGDLSFDQIYTRTVKGVEELAKRKCKLIIIACNTASVKALYDLQQDWISTQNYVQKILGIVRPVVEYITQREKLICNLGLLATTATVSSKRFISEIKKKNDTIRIYQQACPTWVPLIEANEPTIRSNPKKYIAPYAQLLLAQCPSMNAVLLGCTHYSLLKKEIKMCFPKSAEIIESSSIIANSLKDYLRRQPTLDDICSKEGNTSFYTTGKVTLFTKVATQFLGYTVSVQKILMP